MNSELLEESVLEDRSIREYWDHQKYQASVPSGCATLSAHRCVSPKREAHRSFYGLRFLPGFRYVGTIFFNHWPCN